MRHPHAYMKSDLKWEFLGAWSHDDTFRFTWETYTTPQFKIRAKFRSDGSACFDVYEGEELIETGWSTLIRAKRFANRFAAGEVGAFSETKPL